MALYAENLGYDQADFHFDDKHDEFIKMIDSNHFYKNSSVCLMTSSNGRRRMINSMMKELQNTYFALLPIELIDIIFEMERMMEIYGEMHYYSHIYFNEKNTTMKLERILRPTNKHRKHLQETGEVTDLVHIPQEDGTFIYGRAIWKNNIANQITCVFQEMCEAFEKNPADGIKKLFIMLKDHMLWICHHQHLYEWQSLMDMIYTKCYDYWNRFKFFKTMQYRLQESAVHPPEFATIKEFDDIWEQICDIKYFLEHYIPYRLISDSDMFYDSVDMYVSPSHIFDTLFQIYTVTDVHPNDINLQEVREFEMSIYAPEYYNNTYTKYKTVRSGRRIIPEGKQPKFYWSSGQYIQRFV